MDQGRGVEKPSEIQYLKKSTNLWPAQLWHDGHHELLQDRIWMWHTLSLFLPFLALCFFTSKIQCSRLWTFFHHHRCRHVRHHHQKSLSVQGWNLQQRENATAQVLLAQVGLGRKRILSQLVQSRPNSVAVHCNRLIVIVIVCLMVIVLVCFPVSHHPQLVVTVSISVTSYACQCHYYCSFTMSAYI